jgi:hypothetical protein
MAYASLKPDQVYDLPMLQQLPLYPRPARGVAWGRKSQQNSAHASDMTPNRQTGQDMPWTTKYA